MIFLAFNGILLLLALVGRKSNSGNSHGGVIMSKVCSICGKGQASGNNVSHSKRRTRRTFKVNVQKIDFVQDGKTVNGYVCARCLKGDKVQRA